MELRNRVNQLAFHFTNETILVFDARPSGRNPSPRHLLSLLSNIDRNDSVTFPSLDLLLMFLDKKIPVLFPIIDRSLSYDGIKAVY